MKYELDNVYLFCVAHGCDYEQNLPCKDGYYPVHDSLGICEKHYNTTGHDYLMIRASNLVPSPSVHGSTSVRFKDSPFWNSDRNRYEVENLFAKVSMRVQEDIWNDVQFYPERNEFTIQNKRVLEG